MRVTIPIISINIILIPFLVDFPFGKRGHLPQRFADKFNDKWRKTIPLYKTRRITII
tara:strand:- start:531 stop:701 length:171 start_codon:yes stop_codon:yes gene_type:complete